MLSLVSYLYQHFSPEDSVYVYNRAVPAFRFYTKDESIPFDQGTTVLPDELPKDVRRMAAGKRIWAVISHDFIKNREIIKQELEIHNGPVTTMNFPGAWLLLSVPHGTKEILNRRSKESLNDLKTPPSNYLEALKDDRKGQHSIRINDQWRVCFEWKDGNALNVEIVDYH